MTGILDSNIKLRLLACCIATPWLLSPCSADEVKLNDGLSKLTGNLKAIQPSGTLELETPMSGDSLLIKGSSVQKVTLENPEETELIPPTIVRLVNGDQLRGAIEGLNEQTLTLNTKEAGKITIDRSSIASAEFGALRNKVIFSGPSNLSEWTQANSTRDRWQYRRGTLVTTGRASAYKDVGLPQQFALGFVLEWKSEHPPRYEVFFADSVGDSKKRPDRYSFTFNNYGIEIRRYTGKDQKSHTIAQLNRNPRLYPNNQMRVVLRVSRDTGRLQLYINGEPEGDFADPLNNIPDGTGIRLVSESLRGSQLEISNIKVTNYDATKNRHSTEGRDQSKDSMIMQDDERWSGKLTKIEKSDSETIFHFSSPSREEPLQVPGDDVSMIYFSPTSTEIEDPKEVFHEAPSFAISMANEWQIKAISCVMDDKTLTAKHPLLGTLQILRDRVISIDHLEKPKSPQSK